MGLCSCLASCSSWGVQHWSLLVLEWSLVFALRCRSLGELSLIDITWCREVSGGPMSWTQLFHLRGSALTPSRSTKTLSATWLLGSLRCSASVQLVFCRSCSTCRCISDVFVGRKVSSTSYSSAILKVLNTLSFNVNEIQNGVSKTNLLELFLYELDFKTTYPSRHISNISGGSRKILLV